jgi:transketolase
MMTENNLNIMATKIRINALDGIYSANSGHPGGSLSISDLLSVLYFDKMNVDVSNPHWDDRDRLVLSKGHCAPALYGALAEKGYFDKKLMWTLRQSDSILQGHPDMKGVPGVDMSTGSLGLGISSANGMALAGKIDKKDYTVYAILGDGELQEGQVWEAAMFAAHYKLDNLIAFIDLNGLQIDGSTKSVMDVGPVDKKFESFGWNVSVIDGHDVVSIKSEIEKAHRVKDMPSVIIMKTIKGKGVSYMENEAGWHGMAPDKELYLQARAELIETLQAMGGSINE